MTDDDTERSSSGGDGTGPELDRLPPPAFPPGYRRSAAARNRVSLEEPGEGGPEEEGEEEDDVPEGAFISPDEPIRKEARGIPDDAFISPDDPFVPAEPGEGDAGEEATVTGVGEERSVSRARSGRDERPSIHELPYLLDRIAEQINESGARALRVHHEMGHFEAALKSFLEGYLEGSGD